MASMRGIFRKFLAVFSELFDGRETGALDTIDQVCCSTEFCYPLYPHRAYWEQQVNRWGRAVPPLRPSKGDLQIYRTFFRRGVPNRRILILGSTPEIRDLISEEAGAEVYIADFSGRMPADMLRFTKNTNPQNERWVAANWLELPFPTKFFDVILGDVVLHQLTPSFEQIFLEKMRSLLKPEGFFITRLFFLDGKLLQQKLSDITAQVLAGPFNRDQKRTLIKLQTVWLFADLTKRRFNRHLSARRFSELAQEGRFHDPILKEVYNILIADKNSYRDWSPPGEEELIRIISSSFSVKERRAADDYLYAEYFPTFLLSPKSRSSRSVAHAVPLRELCE